MTNASRTAQLARMSAAMAAMVALMAAHRAMAEISFVDMFRSDSFTQTANGNSLSGNGSFFTTSLTSVGANDYSAVHATYPGPGSPVALSPFSSTVLQYQTAVYPTQAAMDADFPPGTYSYAATKTGGGTDSTSFVYSIDVYPRTLPYLAGTNFSGLQGMNPAAPFAIQFSPFTPNLSASEAFLFFTIFDTVTNSFVFNAGFQPATTAGLTLPANTLLPNRSYIDELIFSDRLLVPAVGSDFDAQLGFDLRTTGSFSTAAVPEPSSWILACVGIAFCYRNWRHVPRDLALKANLIRDF